LPSKTRVGKGRSDVKAR